MRGRLILAEKLTDERGNLREMVIWSVPPSARQSEGVRYRLALIKAGEKKPAVLYDNHHPKGHHRHRSGIEEPYRFTDLGALIDDFMVDVSRVMEK